MAEQIRMSTALQASLRCPICHATLKQAGQSFDCTHPECGTHFPIVDGIPVLLNEKSSVFSFDDFISHRKTFFDPAAGNKLKKIATSLIPPVDRNIKAAENYARLNELLLERSSTSRILVIGGSVLGESIGSLINNDSFEFVESDVSFGPRTALICDAHDIPFDDGAFDAVIVQAVLEHVVDPYRCVAEIHRVLNRQGLVYAETPFMQQVHGGRFDFTRFTYLGHRRLFRWFEEVNSGAVCGPGMALAWSYRYFLLSFTTSKILRGLVRLFTGFTSFYLKYIDRYLIDKPGTLDAASAFYFTGRKGERALSDRDLLKLYRGSCS